MGLSMKFTLNSIWFLNLHPHQPSVLRALVSAEQSVQFLFEWTRFHAGFCAHVSSGVLKIYFVAEAENAIIFFYWRPTVKVYLDI